MNVYDCHAICTQLQPCLFALDESARHACIDSRYHLLHSVFLIGNGDLHPDASSWNNMKRLVLVQVDAFAPHPSPLSLLFFSSRDQDHVTRRISFGQMSTSGSYHMRKLLEYKWCVISSAVLSRPPHKSAPFIDPLFAGEYFNKDTKKKEAKNTHHESTALIAYNDRLFTSIAVLLDFFLSLFCLRLG